MCAKSPKGDALGGCAVLVAYIANANLDDPVAMDSSGYGRLVLCARFQCHLMASVRK